MRDSKFTTIVEFSILYPSRVTHWTLYRMNTILVLMDAQHPNFKQIILPKGNRKCVFFVQNQGRDSYCAVHCLYKFYLIKILKIVFKIHVLHSNYGRKRQEK